jgi:hypothetical protein
MCNDFARLGFNNVVVDAGVQLSYDWELAREMSAGKCRYPFLDNAVARKEHGVNKLQ